MQLISACRSIQKCLSNSLDQYSQTYCLGCFFVVKQYCKLAAAKQTGL